ncbi:MAG: sigma 54-interacting transcriptional regulator [Planctomycetaceae bacterium]|jgi:transcriptional regulator with PAS, ATPase and Fis domain|nr:sigma 54-interacting transcriptional regulator [Planctomycetaceae bacterium]
MTKHISISQLSNAFRRAATPVYMLDENQTLIYFNPALQQLVQCEESKLIGLTCRYHVSSSPLHHEIIAAALAPPPEVLIGKPMKTIVTLDAVRQIHQRYADFYPIATEDAFVVFVFLGEKDVSNEEAAQFFANQNGESVETVQAHELHRMLFSLQRHQAGQYRFEHLVGNAPELLLAHKQAKLASRSSVSVLIWGPVGSGKGTLAHAIHFGEGAEKSAGLIPMDCRVLSPELIESTIRAVYNQHEKRENTKCRTLLFSDIDMIAAELEPLICSILDNASENIRLIGTSPFEPCTWKNLEKLAQKIGVIAIRLPGLAERPADIPVSAQWFLEQRNRMSSVQKTGFSAEALDLLKLYHWPGNLDELADVVRQSHESAKGTLIQTADIPIRLHHVRHAKTVKPKTEPIQLETFLRDMELDLIQRALKSAKGNKAKAARLLGMNRPRLYRRMEQLGLIEPMVSDIPDFRPIDSE